jgi:hypothetical protein
LVAIKNGCTRHTINEINRFSSGMAIGGILLLKTVEPFASSTDSITKGMSV